MWASKRTETGLMRALTLAAGHKSPFRLSSDDSVQPFDSDAQVAVIRDSVASIH